MLQIKGGRGGRSDSQTLGSSGFLCLVKVRRALVPPKWRGKYTWLHRTPLGNGISCSRVWMNLQSNTLPFCNVPRGFRQFLPAAPLSFFHFLERERRNTVFPSQHQGCHWWCSKLLISTTLQSFSARKGFYSFHRVAGPQKNKEENGFPCNCGRNGECRVWKAKLQPKAIVSIVMQIGMKAARISPPSS